METRQGRALCRSAEETRAFGRALGELLGPGDVVSLEGELGAGKTCLAGGLAAGLGVDPVLPITSPSYTMANVYEGRCPFYHVDLFRLASAAEALHLGLDEYLAGDGVAAVEWLDRFPALWPAALIRVRLAGAGEAPREVRWALTGPHPAGRGENIAQVAASK